MSYVIEKGVPVPPRNLGRPPKHEFPFYSMKPGDSFLCEKAEASRCQKQASNIHQRHPGSKFTTRKLPDGSMRVWCLKAISKTGGLQDAGLPPVSAAPPMPKIAPPKAPAAKPEAENPVAAKLRQLAGKTKPSVHHHGSR